MYNNLPNYVHRLKINFHKEIVHPAIIQLIRLPFVSCLYSGCSLYQINLIPKEVYRLVHNTVTRSSHAIVLLYINDVVTFHYCYERISSESRLF